MTSYRIAAGVLAVAVAMMQTINVDSTGTDIGIHSAGSQEKTESTEPERDVVQSNRSETNDQVTIDARISTFSTYGSGNVAQNKRALQSSLAYGGVAGRAVDGDPNADYDSGHCSHTGHDLHPWWSVDLGQSFTVHAVTIVNRRDCCGDLLSNFYIGVTDVSPSIRKPSITGPNYKVCWYQRGHEPDDYHTFRCKSPIVGRYVVIQLSTNDYLHLCEVQVEGTTGGLRNLALRRPTYQSSVDYDGVSSRAVNGNVNPYYPDKSCIHTIEDVNNPWWAVDLGSIKQVYTVTLVNRADCCWERLRNFQIGVTNTSPQNSYPSGYPFCVQHYSTQGPGTTVDYTCTRPLYGRYVIVQIVGRGTLTLCEVMVFGR